MRSFIKPVLLLFALVLPCASARAQNAPQTSTLTVRARLVVLDLVVMDKDGKPVEDLTRDDFTVYEDGKAQRVVSFEPPSAHTLPGEEVAAAPHAVLDAAQPAAFGHSPVTMLVLDQLNTRFADSSFARRSLHDYLATQPAVLTQPTTLMVISDNGFRQAIGYTRDRDLLLKAVNATPTHYAWNLEINGGAEHGPLDRLDMSLRALEQMAQSAARIPGRKNLIWVGGGFPTIDPTTLNTRNTEEVRSTIQHITNTLLDTHVTLYAIDPKSLAPGMDEILDEQQMNFAQIAGDGVGGSVASYDSDEDFDRLAPMTGGRTVRGMNDIAHQIAVSVQLGQSFYTIGYAPSSIDDTDVKYRKIRVDCKRPGLTLRTRDGYYPSRATEQRAAETISYDLSTAAESTVALNALSVQVTRSNNVSHAPDTFVVRVAAAGLTWKPADDGTSSAPVQVLAVWLDAKGRMTGHVLHAMTAHARAGVNLADPAKTADFLFVAPTPAKSAKAKTLRFVVRDEGTGRMGSVNLTP